MSYCHWKSNTAIARSASADNDLDLLIAHDDIGRFRAVLSSIGFVRVERQQQPLPPAKEDYFGFDEASGKLVHVDAHYQLVLGHDRTKNHRIPIERAYLDSSETNGLFPLPAPEFEYVVFLVRMVLKYAVWDEIVWQRLRGKSAGLKKSERNELCDLEARISTDRLAEIISEHLPWLAGDLLESCIAIAHDRSSVRERVRTSRRVDAALASHMQHGPVSDSLRRIRRRISFGISRRLAGGAGFRLPSGGAILGVIGGDGSGKSTAIAELDRWLGEEFDVRQIHMGRPPWSTTTYMVRGSLKLVGIAADLVQGVRSTNGPTVVDGLREPAWLACTARDRFLTYRRARRLANRGALVISDRYPHPALTSMDVAVMGVQPDAPSSGPLFDRLRDLERRYHDRIDPPEFLAVLRVDPETAARRKTDEPADYVRRRVAEVWAIDWTGTPVHVVDAARPADEVASELKSLIWQRLR